MQMMRPAAARPGGGGPLWTWIGGTLAGTAAMTALILAHEGNTKYVFTGFAAGVFVLLLGLVGNLRVVAFYSLLFFAPFELRLALGQYPHMGGAAAVFIEAVDPFLVVLLLYQARERIKGYRAAYRIPPALWLWAGLIVLGFGTVLFETLRTLALLEIVRMLKLFLLAAVLVNEIATRRQFTGAITCLMLGVILQASVALVQNIRGSQLGLSFLGEALQEDVKILGETSLEGGQFVYRAGALLGHPNLLAAYLALFLGVAIALLLTRAPRLLKVLSFVALALGTPTLVLTLSRTGWIDFLVVFVIAIALGTWNATSRRGYVFSRVAVVLAVVIVGAAMSPLIITRLQRADPTSVEHRLKWIKTARAMVMDNPFFGVGLNSYVFRQLPYSEYRTPQEMTNAYGEMWPVVHNHWLIVWSEEGTAGMIVWVAFHIAVIVVALRNLKIRDPTLHAIGVGLLAGFVAIMVDGLASFFVRQEGTARMFWIVTALILALDHWRRANEYERPPVGAAVPPGREALPALESAPRQGRWLPGRASLLQ